nr:FAD-binding domain-containing protein [Tropicimonas marinistellae]
MNGSQDISGRGRGTRRAGLDLLDAFRPRMGARYAANRNVDAGPGRQTSVSHLSPYIRRRLVTEAEVVAAALDAHGPDGAGKFIQEVIWRGYFKGWLEHRPSIWESYRSGLVRDLAELQENDGLRSRLEAAEGGTSGLECFDVWARELTETGYLHNHARMWFASIWIFTLRLPWRIGADFFLRNLVDGDPASNTLGWRWVAGLHTRGKAYQATASNIARFTEDRFRLRASELAAEVVPLDHEEPGGLPPLRPLREVSAPQARVPTALLITEEDCGVESFGLSGLDIQACATLAGSELRSDRPVAAAVSAFEQEALDDSVQRSGLDARRLRAAQPPALADWATEAGVRQIVTPYVPEGPLRDHLLTQLPVLERRGISLCELRRDWDRAIWPHATAGFFKVKKRIPGILRTLEMRCR